jgi:hypothetical protein
MTMRKALRQRFSLSDALWRRARYGGDASILGKTIEVDHGLSKVIA